MLGELLSVLWRISELRAKFLKHSQKSHFQLYWPCINTFDLCATRFLRNHDLKVKTIFLDLGLHNKLFYERLKKEKTNFKRKTNIAYHKTRTLYTNIEAKNRHFCKKKNTRQILCIILHKCKHHVNKLLELYCLWVGYFKR